MSTPYPRGPPVQWPDRTVAGAAASSTVVASGRRRPGPRQAILPAKRRLAGILDSGQRAELARWLADRRRRRRPAVAGVRGVRRRRVSPTWADAAGAEVLWSPGLGLNGAVDAGRATIAGKGFDHLVIVHSDIPLAHDLDAGRPGRLRQARARPPPRRHQRVRRSRRRAPSRRRTAPGRSRGTCKPRDAEPGTASRSASTPSRPRRRHPRRPGPSPPRACAAAMAANDPGQPPLSPTSGPAAGWTPTSPAPTSALAVGAHPDDVEFGAGGTLAKWAAAGCVVHHLVCTDGSKGTWDPTADLTELVARRQGEQREAARRLAGDEAGEVVFLGRVDGELDSDRATRRRRGPRHPPAAAGGRARPRPLEALPAPSRSSPRRPARLRGRRGRPRPALLPRARARPTTVRRLAALGGGRAHPRRGRDVDGRAQARPPSRRTRASSSRR